MPFLVSALVSAVTQKVLSQLAVAALHEAAKRSGSAFLLDLVHDVAPVLGVDLPADLPARSTPPTAA